MSLSERYWSGQDDLITRTAETASVCTGLSVFVYTAAFFYNNATQDLLLTTERKVRCFVALEIKGIPAISLSEKQMYQKLSPFHAGRYIRPKPDGNNCVCAST